MPQRFSQPSAAGGNRQHDQVEVRGRQNSKCAAQVESAQRNAAPPFALFQQQGCDQIAANRKKQRHAQPA
jgi:hypothetical protein